MSQLLRYRTLFKMSFLVFLIPLSGYSQIIPAGLGEIDAGSWFALGWQQNIGQNQWSSTTYFGVGRRNEEGFKNPFQNHALLVLNQEFKNRFHDRWEYSLAGGYRNLTGINNQHPDKRNDDKQEFRIYGRLSYLYQTGKLRITPTLRQEFIKYYDPDFKDYSESIRLRSRFRVKFYYPIDTKAQHGIAVYSEQLFSISQSGISNEWGNFRYSDSRFSLYYSWSPSELPLAINVGYMCNVIGKKWDHTAHYLGVDLLLKNIF